MANESVAMLLASKLGELIHPGDDKNPATVLSLPGFRTTGGMPPQLAEEVANQAKLVAEAIVATIEDGGSVILPKEQYRKIVAAAEAVPQPPRRQPKLACSACQTALFSLNVDADNPSVNGPMFLEALGHLSTACPHTPS